MIFAVLVTLSILIAYGIYTYIEYELDTIRLRKDNERRRQRDADKQQTKGSESRETAC